MQAHRVNKLRNFFFVNMVLGIIFLIVVPGIKETRRQGKVTEQDIKTYIKNSQIVELTAYQTVGEVAHREKYFNDAPLVRKPAKKEVTTVKDLETNRLYRVELYHPQSFTMISEDSKAPLYLWVNSRELKKPGTIEEPTIVLRYAMGYKDYANYVAEYKYLYNVREYLTYKDHVPIPNDRPLYYIPMIWAAITIAGFSWPTGTLIKRGYITKEGTYDATGSRWKKGE